MTQEMQQRFLDNIGDLERRAQQRQDEIKREVKNEIGNIIDERIAGQERLTADNYKKALNSIITLEHRLDAKQGELLAVLRDDFSKAIAQLDNTKNMRELSESFDSRMQGMETKLEDQSRALRGEFEGLIK